MTTRNETQEGWWGWFKRNLTRVGDRLVSMIPRGNVRRRNASPNPERQYATSECLLGERCKKRFLIRLFGEEEEEELDEVIMEFYEYFMMEGAKRLAKEQRGHFLVSHWEEPEYFFDDFMSEGKESFFGFFEKIEEEGFGEEREREEFFNYFLGVDLEKIFEDDFEDYVVGMYRRIRISNWLITEIVSKVINRQRVTRCHTHPRP